MDNIFSAVLAALGAGGGVKLLEVYGKRQDHTDTLQNRRFDELSLIRQDMRDRVKTLEEKVDLLTLKAAEAEAKAVTAEAQWKAVLAMHHELAEAHRSLQHSYDELRVENTALINEVIAMRRLTNVTAPLTLPETVERKIDQIEEQTPT